MSYQELQQEPSGKAVTPARSAQSAGCVQAQAPRPVPIPFLRALVARVQTAIRLRHPAGAPTKPETDSLRSGPAVLGAIRDWDDSVCELPVDEEVRLWSISIAEAYPPSCVPALQAALSRLGWDVPNRYGANGLSADELCAARTGRGLSFCGLGTMRVAGELNDLLGYRTVELPVGFERVHVTAHHPVPSITILIFQFVLTYEASRELTELFQREDPALQEDLSAWMRRTGPMRREMERATRSVRERQRNACAEWVSSRVPGLFAAYGGVPAAEFITLEKAEPLSGSGVYHPAYVQALGLNYTFYASELWGSQGLRLAWPLSFGSRGDLLFSGRMDELSEHEGPDGPSMLDFVDNHIRDTLVPWALYEGVRRSAERVTILRDQVADLTTRDPQDAVRALGAVQREFMRLVVDTVPMEREVRELCEDAKRYHRDSNAEFMLIGIYESVPQGKEHVFEHVRKRTAEEADRLGRTSMDLREMITTTSSILNSLAQERATEENLRLQRRVYWMTIIFGVLAALLSVMQILG